MIVCDAAYITWTILVPDVKMFHLAAFFLRACNSYFYYLPLMDGVSCKRLRFVTWLSCFHNLCSASLNVIRVSILYSKSWRPNGKMYYEIETLTMVTTVCSD
jgi:hypothetical protein